MDIKTKKYHNAYNSQKAHARIRGVEWRFESFEQWLAWWGDDIDNRGRGIGKLVMARHGDKGPYHPDNVKKITHEENCRENGWNNKGKPRTDDYRELKRQQAQTQQRNEQGHFQSSRITEKQTNPIR